MMLARTFLDTRLAVGLLGCIQGYGSVRPTIKCSITIGNIANFFFSWDSLLTAMGIIINRSMYKNFRHAQHLLGNSHKDTYLEISQR